MLKSLNKRALALETLFIKVKDNPFLYSMLISVLMNSSLGTSKGRSEINRIGFLSEEERNGIFYRDVLNIPGEFWQNPDSTVDDIYENLTNEDIVLLDTYNELNAHLNTISKERGYSKGGIWMWLPAEGDESYWTKDFVNQELLKKDKEHFCGGGANYVYQILVQNYGKLDISDSAFNSVSKFYRSPEAMKTVVYDQRSLLSFSNKKRNNIKKNIIRAGMIALVASSAKGKKKGRAGHWTYVNEVLPNGQWKSFESNTGDSRVKGRGITGITSKTRSVDDIMLLSAPQPIFEIQARQGLVSVMEKMKKSYIQSKKASKEKVNKRLSSKNNNSGKRKG